MPIYVRNFLGNSGDNNTFESGAVINSVEGLASLIGNENLDKSVSEMTVFQMNDMRNGHWELYFEGPEVPLVKIDLMQDKYRILYGARWAQFAEGRDPTTRDKLNFKGDVTLRNVVQCAVHVMTDKGDWMGTETYNCQDFVVEFLKRMGEVVGRNSIIYPSVSVALKYELRRYVMKNDSSGATWS